MKVFRFLLLGMVALAVTPTVVSAQTPGTPRVDILSSAEWSRVDRAAEQGLRYLATRQDADGSLPTHQLGQPGVTALAVLAFLQHGHLPGEGPHGETIDRAIGYILRCQQRSGLLSVPGVMSPRGPIEQAAKPGVAGSYNHAIAGLALGEAYGLRAGADRKLREPIERAIETTLAMQSWKKQRPVDRGGVRYLRPHNDREADLSVLSWHLKFLRSAKNAGFDVPDEAIDNAVAYVLRCYSPELGSFEYEVSPSDRRTRAMAGVGILALAHSSRHNSREALSAADWLLKQSFTRYNRQARYGNYRHNSDRYHYGVFYSTLAMYQMGGRHWEQFFPPVAKTLLANQNRDGSWDPEAPHDRHFGSTYTTSLMVLALGAPNQLLPIYQR